ncbi:hypothetical protein L227DRAFT_599105 [Lentinus tigrinus ALCF2SS1-6]|uniref:Uncharacterized protein n=1 Tax=Lentinus tigrinus ALCF2SS1-6 TaxID=1328759 RepID=A0A5C2SIC4_9APHY|nr:hypothetical protein L227DRAFT_599105 [Lentinus tigrinus ALCF2SS1-6]
MLTQGQVSVAPSDLTPDPPLLRKPSTSIQHLRMGVVIARASGSRSSCLRVPRIRASKRRRSELARSVATSAQTGGARRNGLRYLSAPANGSGASQVKEEDLTWVAVDVVASTLQDMAMIETVERALHLVSPKPVPWNSVFIPIAERLGVPVVPYAEWLARLEKSAVVASECPGVAQHDSAHNLISFFKHEGMGGASIPLNLEKALRCSKALADVQPIGREDALRYVEFWENVGYVKPSSV